MQKLQKGVYRLQLVLNPDARDLLDQLREASEAESYGELIRRALKALELFHPIEESELISATHPVVASEVLESRNSRSTRLQIQLAQKSMDRLERFRFELEKETGKGSYSEVVRCALRIFAQVYLANDLLPGLTEETSEVNKVDNNAVNRKLPRNMRSIVAAV